MSTNDPRAKHPDNVIFSGANPVPATPPIYGTTAAPSPQGENDAEMAVALDEIQTWFGEGYGPNAAERAIGRQFLRMKRESAEYVRVSTCGHPKCRLRIAPAPAT